jgi:hypothetical protein
LAFGSIKKVYSGIDVFEANAFVIREVGFPLCRIVPEEIVAVPGIGIFSDGVRVHIGFIKMEA